MMQVSTKGGRRLAALCVAGTVFAGPVSAQTGDAARGEDQFRKCVACHAIGADRPVSVGPHLSGVVGRPAAAQEGYFYSGAMLQAADGGLVWTTDALDRYLADPDAVIPGTTMVFQGIADAGARSDLIAFLAGYTGDTASDPDGVSFAVAPEILAIAGDPAYGEYLSSECTACHANAATADGIPSIGGRETEDFVTVMQAYKQGIMAHPVMTMMAQRLSDEEIAALAAYYTTLN